MVLMIPAGSVELESHIREPETEPRGVAILCHPHPVYGGTMDNRVIYRSAKSAARAGFAAIRFNFRGAGKSTGQFDHGIGEKDDVAAVIDWVEDKYSGKPLAILGYSFGAWVGLQVGVAASSVRALVGLGLPLDLYNLDFLADNSYPSLYIVGTEDEFCSRSNLESLAHRLPPSSKVETIQGADHFFSGHIEQVEKLIESFFRGLPPDQARL